MSTGVSCAQDYVNALANLLPSKQLQLSEAAAQRITQLTQEAVCGRFSLPPS